YSGACGNPTTTNCGEVKQRRLQQSLTELVRSLQNGKWLKQNRRKVSTSNNNNNQQQQNGLNRVWDAINAILTPLSPQVSIKLE
ncbi:hypothetical protein A2U01_0064874, partial [Trifolium medium]|nr:hypothetical protein [Trifolium medium]